MRIGFLSTDWGDHAYAIPGGCTQIRMVNPGNQLKIIGHETFVGEIGWKDNEGFVAVKPLERIRFNQRGVIKTYEECVDKLDVIILKLFMHKDAVKYINLAKSYGQTVIIDTDDHFEQLPEDNLAFITTDPERNPDNNRQHLIDTYSHADGIIVSTKFLEERMLKYNKNVYRVENSLDPKDFIYRLDFSGNKPTIGWVGMMAWRTEDIKIIAGPVSTVINQNNLKFHHSGAMLDKPYLIADTIGIDHSKLNYYTGSRPEYYPHVFLPIDIGIVPLTKNQFNEAKSNLKGLEYALSGVPFVASDTQEYRDLADSGVGRVAKNPKDWIKHLNKLLDPKIREEERQKNYINAVQKYNIFIKKYKWSEAIELIQIEKNKSKKINLLTAV